MIHPLELHDFLELGENFSILDTRSPAEFSQGHIPGAISYPLFSDEERAEIGTLYKQEGKQQAVLKGLDFIGPKMRTMAEEALKHVRHNRVLVHCWRGGMRSGSVALLLQSLGLEVYVLKGGYKTFRTAALDFFNHEFPLVVLGGMTGSGKSEILRELARRGHQFLDLERLAHHKGSAFGWLNEPPQPTSEHFENLIYMQLRKMDRNATIWVEDESHNVGKAFIPIAFWNQMRTAPVIRIDMPQALRVKRLVQDYAHAPKAQIQEAVMKIERKLGGDRLKEALLALEENNYELGARIALDYYDKAYTTGISRRDPATLFPVATETEDAVRNAALIERFFLENEQLRNFHGVKGS